MAHAMARGGQENLWTTQPDRRVGWVIHMTCDLWHAQCDMWQNYKYSLLSIDMKTKVVQHVPRINTSISHITCDMWKAKCDMWHNYKNSLLSLHMKTKYVQHAPENQHKHLTYDMWHVQCDMWHMTCEMWHETCDIITNTHFWVYTWKQKLFSMSQGST